MTDEHRTGDHETTSEPASSVVSGRLNLLRAVLIVAVVFVLAEAGARVAEQSAAAPPVRWYDEAAQLRVEMMDGRTADLVFAGTSMAQQAFVPSDFDQNNSSRSFNVGLPGAVPTVSGPWLTEVVIDRLEPATVVWGLSSLDLASGFGDQPTEAWQSAPETRSDVLGRADSWLADRSALIRMRTLLRRPEELWGTAGEQRALAFTQEQELTGADGERLGFDAERSLDGELINRNRLERFTVDADDVNAIRAAVISLQASGVRVVLVELPVPPAFIELHPRGSVDHNLVSAVIQDLAAELGVDHVGLDLIWNDSDFADFTHLNADGAAAFTRLVSDQLDGTRRGDLVPEPNGALGLAAHERETLKAQSIDDCDSDVVLDEYGFEIDIANCASRETAAGPLPFPNDVVESAFDLLLLRSGAAAANCSSAATWRDSTASAIESLRQLTSAVGMLEDEDEWIGSDDADRLVDSASFELLGQPACGELLHASQPETIAVVGRAIRELNALSIAVEGDNAGGGPFWYRTDQAGHVDRVRDLLAEGEPIEVLTIGSSTVKRGIDSEMLGNAVGRGVFNTGVAALSPEVAGPWLATLIDLDVQPVTVVVGFNSFEQLTPCTEARRNEMGRSLALQSSLLRLGIDVATIPLPDDDPFLVAYSNQFDVRGTSRSGAVSNPDRVSEQLDRYRQRLRNDVCERNMIAFSDLIDAVRRAFPAAKIIVLDMPVHPEMFAAHPGGRGPSDEVSSRAQQIATSVDADYLNARELLTAEEFSDLLHANSLGRSRLTEYLANTIDN